MADTRASMADTRLPWRTRPLSWQARRFHSGARFGLFIGPPLFWPWYYPPAYYGPPAVYYTPARRSFTRTRPCGDAFCAGLLPCSECRGSRLGR